MRRRHAIAFILLLGLVSLLADVTYEGARSITGPYLALLGAGAGIVGLVAGAGELIGYALRLVFGVLADRTRRYWAFTIVGYALNLLAVPLLALANSWEIAAALIVLERTGKAIRAPARDTLLSHATEQTGRGWGFGLHEAMDQIGALLGPLVVAGILARMGNYRLAFAALAVPAVLAMVALFTARALYPAPEMLGKNRPSASTTSRRLLPRTFWLYLIASVFIAAGYADFPLLAFHFERTNLMPATWIPLMYAVAMATDAITALIFGRLYDRLGLRILALSVALSLFFAPLVFLGNVAVVFVGVVLWGVGLGAQESIMRAAVADLVPSAQRGTAYGLFNAAYGFAWFVGSAIIGLLYESTLWLAIAFSVLVQIAAIITLQLVRPNEATA
ncbi:MFS transporter [Ardenticatena maritima]|uniref:MFS transporter n=3 Tax=Ardenticatena maritima TaxID=872965 RepID=A0A0P6YW81_9CHLR|nr:MFS transporter [Ardenticatena maritima]KPL88332.1 MFS transporter [Ardenticatena maritima]